MSSVHFSVDLWTSPNSLAILGVVAHYITATRKLDHSILALQEVDSEHTSANQATKIMQVIEDYGIENKVGYFVMDNASNNDTLIKHLSDMLMVNHNID